MGQTIVVRGLPTEVGVGRRQKTIVCPTAIRQFADEGQILFHIRFHGAAGVGVGLEVGVAGEADLADGGHHFIELDFAFAQVVGIVFQMDLADALSAQPADLFGRVETGVGGIADVVIHLHVFGARAVENARVILGRNGVFEGQDYARLFRFRRQRAHGIAHGVAVGRALDGALAEKRQQQHLGVQGLGEADGIAHPFERHLVVFEAVDVQNVGAGAVNGDFVLGGKLQVAVDQVGIIHRHFSVYRFAAEGDLDAIEAQPRGQRHGLRVRAQLQIPVGDPDAQFPRGGAEEGAGGGSGGSAQGHAASRIWHGAILAPGGRAQRATLFA